MGAAEESQGRMLESLRAADLGAVVLAGADDGVELIARHRADLVERGYHPAEADDAVLLAMLDKLRTYELAREHGIAAPQVVRLPDGDALEAALERLEFPCILKPVHSHLFARRGGSGAKVVVVNSPMELRDEFARLSALDVEMFVTEVIYGQSDEFVSFYGYLDEQGTSLVNFTKRKIRQYPPGFGTGTYHETTDDPDVAAAGLRFLQAVSLRGLGNVEFKRDTRDGRLILIECNPRVTLSNEVIRAAGVDLALLSYRRALRHPTPRIDGYRVGLHLWDPVNDLRALPAYRRQGELSLRRWAGSLMHRQLFPALRVDDPLPALARLRWMIGGAVSSGRKGADVPSTGSAPRRDGGAPARLGGVNRVLDRLASRGGRRGRAVAARLDLTHSSGIGPLWRRVRAERSLSALGPTARDRLYERIWNDAAERCGAEAVRLAPGLLELSRDAARTRVYHQVVELDDPVTLQAALDKALVHRLMSDIGVPHADHVEWSADDPRPALSFLANADGPCVVKPAAGTGGGHGVVPGVESPEDLMRASWHAGKRVDQLLIERQASGSVYRLLLLDRELLDVVRSVPSHLAGDGRSTIEELIAGENQRRLDAAGAAGLSLIGLSLDTVLTLRRAGMTLSSVPPAGQQLALRVATNDNAARDSETWRAEVCASVLDQARGLAGAVGLRLAGVDVVTTDIGKPLAETGGVISEVNGSPGLHHHYLVADPVHATPVAVPLLERLLARDS